MLRAFDIPARHLPPLQATVMKHRSKLDEDAVGRLYRQARLLFSGERVAVDPSMICSRIFFGTTVIATCTDSGSGLFIQLSGEEGAAPDDLLLAFGQKFCQEAKDEIRGHIATKMW